MVSFLRSLYSKLFFLSHSNQELGFPTSYELFWFFVHVVCFSSQVLLSFFYPLLVLVQTLRDRFWRSRHCFVRCANLFSNLRHCVPRPMKLIWYLVISSSHRDWCDRNLAPPVWNIVFPVFSFDCFFTYINYTSFASVWICLHISHEIHHLIFLVCLPMGFSQSRLHSTKVTKKTMKTTDEIWILNRPHVYWTWCFTHTAILIDPQVFIFPSRFSFWFHIFHPVCNCRCQSHFQFFV